jgi:hypothetical protein
VELGLGQVEGDGARWVLERVLAVRDLGRVRSQAICFFARFRGVFNRLDKNASVRKYAITIQIKS